MHASAVIIGNRGVLIRGKSGAGKSSLALSLIEKVHLSSHFAGLVSDDQTILTNVNGLLLARCPDAIAGRMEIRGYGIIRHDWTRSAIIHLVVNVVTIDKMERMPRQKHCDIEGISIPQLSVPGHFIEQSVRMILAMLAIS